MNVRALLRPAALGTAVAIVGVLAVYLLARATGDPLQVVMAGVATEVPIGAAVLFTVLGGLVGLGLAMVTQRLRRPRTAFLAITGVGLLLSLFPSFSAAPAGTALWLDAMHLVAAAGILPFLARALPRERVPAGIAA